MLKKRLYGMMILIVGIMLAFSFTGCGDSDSGNNGGGGDSDLSGTITISPSSGTVGTQLTATYSGSETVTYQWKRGSTNVGTNSRTYTPDQAGSYTVTVSAAGYKSKTSAAVTVTSGGGGTGGLSGTYKYEESEEGMTMAMMAIFSGNQVTLHVKMDVPFFPSLNTDEDMVKCTYSVQNNKVIIVSVIWVNPKYPEYGEGEGGEEGDNILFTIVNATTLRDSDGQNWIKQ